MMIALCIFLLLLGFRCKGHATALQRSFRMRRIGCFTCLLLATCAGSLSHADETTARFLWDQANTTLSSAKTPEDYLTAAHAYNRLVVQEGVRNGPLFFNLGTALLLAGDGNNAVDALIRAERFDGCTTDIRTNLRLAIALKSERQDADLPWSRVAFFWHFNIPLRIRLLIACGGWMTVFIALFLRLLANNSCPKKTNSSAAAGARLQTAAGSCLFAGVLLLVIFGSSAVVSLLQEREQDKTWADRVFVSHLAEERGS